MGSRLAAVEDSRFVAVVARSRAVVAAKLADMGPAELVVGRIVAAVDRMDPAKLAVALLSRMNRSRRSEQSCLLVARNPFIIRRNSNIIRMAKTIFLFIGVA